MNTTIWKYPIAITDVQVIEVPANGKILTAQFQSGKLCLWVMVDPTKEKLPRKIYVVGTGNPFPTELLPGNYIGTVQQIPYTDARHGTHYIPTLVWHIFEK